MKVDAIVNAANTDLLMGGGVCGAIFNAAGPKKLSDACMKLAPIRTGEAVITKGFSLAAKHVIHAVGPVYRDGNSGEEALLRACYVNSLELAKSHGCESVAFPLISSGIYGYPKDEALSVATGTIGAWLGGNDADIDVSLVVFDKTAFKLSQELQGEVQSFIDENFVDEREKQRRVPPWPDGAGSNRTESLRSLAVFEDAMPSAPEAAPGAPPKPPWPGEPSPQAMPSPLQKASFPQGPQPSVMRPPQAMQPPQGVQPPSAMQPPQAMPPPQAMQPPSQQSVDYAAYMPASPGMLGHDAFDYGMVRLDEPFSATLLRIIDGKGRTDVDVYKRANIDRKLFSKIRTGKGYMPSKKTVVALAVALELSLSETRDLLECAGFAFSRSVVFDVIVEYFITHRMFDIFEINNVLFEYDQPLLGG